MVVTKHATKRVRQRNGLSKKSVVSDAQRALEKGIQHKDTSGSLNRYITQLYFKDNTADNIRIYNNSVYIFKGKKLITVFPLPQKYRNTVKNIKTKKEKENYAKI